jgi:multidrug efflux pump
MMLPELSIRRPVLATVMSLAIVLIGLMAYTRLAIREYPNIDEPVVSVETRYPGAGAEIVESQITVPLEDSLAGIEGIDVISSVSRPEQSQISVRFRLARNPDGAAADVRDRVARVRSRLPDDIDEPVISKVEADAQPIVYLASPPTVIRPSTSRTTPTATSRTGCRTCPGSPTSASSASGATPCASGSTGRGSPPTT